MSLAEGVRKAREASHHKYGKCSMCACGDEPEQGFHREQYPCGNEYTCILCHNAGMEYGDQCAAWSANECCCGADWTPKELIDARARIKELEAENAKLKADLDFDHKEYKRLRDDLKQEVARLSAHIRAIAAKDQTMLLYSDYFRDRRDFALKGLE